MDLAATTVASTFNSWDDSSDFDDAWQPTYARIGFTLRKSDGDVVATYGNLAYGYVDQFTVLRLAKSLMGCSMVSKHGSLVLHAQDSPKMSYRRGREGQWTPEEWKHAIRAGVKQLGTISIPGCHGGPEAVHAALLLGWPQPLDQGSLIRAQKAAAEAVRWLSQLIPACVSEFIHEWETFGMVPCFDIRGLPPCCRAGHNPAVSSTIAPSRLALEGPASSSREVPAEAPASVPAQLLLRSPPSSAGELLPDTPTSASDDWLLLEAPASLSGGRLSEDSTSSYEGISFDALASVSAELPPEAPASVSARLPVAASVPASAEPACESRASVSAQLPLEAPVSLVGDLEEKSLGLDLPSKVGAASCTPAPEISWEIEEGGCGDARKSELEELEEPGGLDLASSSCAAACRPAAPEMCLDMLWNRMAFKDRATEDQYALFLGAQCGVADQAGGLIGVAMMVMMYLQAWFESNSSQTPWFHINQPWAHLYCAIHCLFMLLCMPFMHQPWYRRNRDCILGVKRVLLVAFSGILKVPYVRPVNSKLADDLAFCVFVSMPLVHMLEAVCGPVRLGSSVPVTALLLSMTLPAVRATCEVDSPRSSLSCTAFGALSHFLMLVLVPFLVMLFVEVQQRKAFIRARSRKEDGHSVEGHS
eukprot:jgi/Botrbrau1/20504/Bobra.145_2s0062.3